MTGAVLSVGTNSTRALLARFDSGGFAVEFSQSIGTRLGEGLGPSGELRADAMDRTIGALRELHAHVRGRYDRLWTATTSAVRRAHNAAVFLTRVETLLGAPMEVLSGEDEARAAYCGATAAVRPEPGQRIGVLDSGGGSTEFAVGSGTRASAVLSCEIGAVRLTEAVPQLDGRSGAVPAEALHRARSIARAELAPLARFERGIQIVLVGGSATTTAAIANGESAGLDTVPVARADLDAVLTELCSMNVDRRRSVGGMRPQRADILPAGIVILDTALQLLEARSAIVSRWDLLLGILLERAAGAATGGNG